MAQPCQQHTSGPQPQKPPAAQEPPGPQEPPVPQFLGSSPFSLQAEPMWAQARAVALGHQSILIPLSPSQPRLGHSRSRQHSTRRGFQGSQSLPGNVRYFPPSGMHPKAAVQLPVCQAPAFTPKGGFSRIPQARGFQLSCPRWPKPPNAPPVPPRLGWQ